MTYHQVVPPAARSISIWNLEGLFKMDSNGQTTLNQDVPRAVEVGTVGLWILRGCDYASVCVQISTTTFTKKQQR